MASADSFLSKFGGQGCCEETDEEMPSGNSGSLGTFLDKFGGSQMESRFHYDGEVEIRFDPVDHIYYRVEEMGNLTAVLNVSTVSHIVDKSFALVPWCAKVTVEKMLRIIPVQTISTGLDDLNPLVIVPAMSLAAFTKLCLEAKTAHKDSLEDAGDVGHMAHRWIEEYIKTLLATDVANRDKLLAERCKDERATKATTAMLGWAMAHNVRFIATEKKLFSREHNCSGTCDGLAMTDSCSDPTCCKVFFRDHLSLIDWKTSNFLYCEFVFQTAGYQGFHLEEFPEVQIVDRWIIRLGKDDAEFDPWYLPAETFADDYEGFLACLHLKRIAIRSEERLKIQKQGVRSAKKAAKDAAKELAKARDKADKAAAKAEARIAKEEEVKRIKAEAKVERERLREEARNAKAIAKGKGKIVVVSVANAEVVESQPPTHVNVEVVKEAVENALADNRLAGLPAPDPEVVKAVQNWYEEKNVTINIPMEGN
jgi:hypothetical protein